MTDITSAQVIKTPHVLYNSGNNEWYTPEAYIQAAREVLRRIDLDPASSEEANTVVGATAYFSAEDDGLSLEWRGNVWMNPPYSKGLIGKFADKLVEHFASGDVTAAIVLVNNATDTAWFHTLASVASCICFTRGRVRFWSSDGKVGAPLQGQAIIYLGKDAFSFRREFKRFGIIATL